MATPAQFEIRDTAVRFGATAALRSITTTIAPGERVALVGPSGAGKSSFMNLLNGTVKPSEGQVLVSGTDFATASPRAIREIRSRIGFVHQRLNLIPNLRVVHNVLLGRLGQMGLLRSLALVFHPSEAHGNEVYRILDRVGIPEKMYQRTDQLSGGQQQRVAIARALFQQPDALLADEPVSSVDPARARDVVELLNKICEEEQLCLVMSLHNLELARAYFPRLIGLRNGEIVFDRNTAEVNEDEFAALYELDDAEMLEDGG